MFLGWIPFWLWLYRDDPASSTHVSRAELDHIRGGPEAGRPVAAFGTAEWRLVFDQPDPARQHLGRSSLCFYVFFMTWLPNYLHRTYGLESRGGRRVLVSAVVSRRRAAVELRSAVGCAVAPDLPAAERALERDPIVPALRGAGRHPGRARPRSRGRLHLDRAWDHARPEHRVLRDHHRCRAAACGHRAGAHEHRFCALGVHRSRGDRLRRVLYRQLRRRFLAARRPSPLRR